MGNQPVIQTDCSLKRYNSFAIDVNAEYFTTISSAGGLSALIQSHIWHDHPRFILGGGSNILFSKNFMGLVVKIEIPGIERFYEDEQIVKLRVGAGVNWHELVLETIKQDWHGLENLSLIPGTVGAAPIQNIGAYGVELKDIFESLVAIDVETGEVCRFSSEQCHFGYRNSIFKTEYKNQYIIVSVDLRLSKQQHFNTSYRALSEVVQAEKAKHISLSMISDAVIKIRQSKLPDPVAIPNAGSFFKNPVLSIAEAQPLIEAFPDMPVFHVDAYQVKIPAAWLIETCGWKGQRRGEVGVYDKQALVLINYGEAIGSDIVSLANEISEDVYDRFQIRLAREVMVI